MTRLKILAIAFACDPAKGSEYGVGWGWVNAIATTHDVTVITADFNAESIRTYLNAHHISTSNGLRFRYVKNRPWHYRPDGPWIHIENSIAKPIMNFAYHDWLRYAFAEAEHELTHRRYDLVHLITFVGWRFPGTFYRLGIPFVWGPIGGMKNTPLRLLPILGTRGAIYYAARNLINSLQLRILHGPRRALRASNEGVIAATSEIQQELHNRFGVTSRVICEVGPPNLVATNPAPRGEKDIFKISWSGQHLPGKALPLLLRAVAALPRDLNFIIEILGDGPCNRDWRALASRLHIEERCHWHGCLPRDRCLSVMRDSHVFAITSLKDLTSTVAVEAISLGLPIISLDHCGFADLVTDQCGIKVHPGSAEQIVSEFSKALRTLYVDEALRMRLALGAIKRSRDYSWQSKMEHLDDIYRMVIPSNALDNAEQLATAALKP
jgi:glycosyltransferase involved in cell wall biosynthesis